MSPERVFLHVGLYKTGTTYLQNLMRRNRRTLARAGVYLPAGPRRAVVFAGLDLIGRQFRGVADPRVPGAWDRLVADVGGCGLPTAVVSEERLSVATPRQARRAASSFGAAQVHVVVTVRDLGRVLVSHWQEEVKNGATWTLDEYTAAVRDPDAVGRNPARGFWMHEDVTAVLRAWGAAVPTERMHVVTVPPSGAASDELAARFGSVVGFTPGDLPRHDFWSNENLGPVGTELLRRLNERLDHRPGRRLHGIEHERGVKIPLTRALAALPRRSPTTLPEVHTVWAAAQADRFAGELRAGGYDVVGDLADLQPATPPTSAHDAGSDSAVDDVDLLDAALEALAALATRQGRVLAAADTRSGAARADLAGARSRLLSHARTLAFRAQRTAADLAARTAPGRRLTAAYLRRRAGR